MTIASKEAFPSVDDPVRLAMAKKAIILDVETTGLDTSNDEIIELAMLELFYDEQGIISIGEVYDEFNEPQKKKIDDEVSRLTNITNEMVEGCRINPADVKRMLQFNNMIIAHHASFDRKMVENNLPDCGFEEANWSCSVNEVDWLARGKSARSLEVLALSEGLVYGSHRADADCIATAFILKGEDSNGRSALDEIISNGSAESMLIIAEGSPFSSKDALKERGYRWDPDGTETFGIKSWYKEITTDPETMSDEAEFLRNSVFGKDVSIPSYRISPSTRYSGRKPGAKTFFRTAEVRSLEEVSDMRENNDLRGMAL